MNSRIVITVIGFLLFIFGLLSLLLSIAGLQFTWMKFLDNGGKPLGLVIRLMMTFIGVVLMAYARIDWAAERAELEAAD